MAEHSGPAAERHVWVRVIVRSFATELESAINLVLEEEQAGGAEVVDIKLTSTPPPVERHGTVSPSFHEHVAVILLRSGRVRP